MSAFGPITIRQPQPHDLVDDPVVICGIGVGLVAGIRVRDAAGMELATTNFQVGGQGTWANFHHALALGGVPGTPSGTLEVFGFSGNDGSEINKVIVPIVFGVALINPYHGFGQHTVVQGETLRSISQQHYQSANLWQRIFEANTDQISNPDLIVVGQTLRIPS